MNELMAQMGGWEGYKAGLIGVYEAGRKGPRAEVWIELLGNERPRRCSGCGHHVDRIHDATQRWVRDLPIFEYEVHLLVWRFRLDCPRCGPKVESLNWLEPRARVTNRLAESVARMCKVLPIKQVAEHFHLHWDTVKAIDKAHLDRELGPPELRGAETLLMDEFALRKGHRYATVVLDAARKRVLWVGQGRGRADIRPFFELLGKRGCAQIKAVGMDMSAAFELEVRKHCPKAEIVYDLFHVVQRYGHEVIDRVRVDEANRLRGDKSARKVVKSAKWLLLRNPRNLEGEARVRLKELLDANQALMTAYVLKDDLKELWRYRREGWARRAWNDWLERAKSSNLAPLVRFAQNLAARLDGILSHCRWPLHTSLLEGINNRIKVIKRMAYGFRDDAYFFLKIRAAFPGVP